MEQQKIKGNVYSQNKQNYFISDYSSNIQKSQRSLHHISNSNIKSNSKIIHPSQFVISYNFQNDPNCQVRTHNLLLGLDSIAECQPKNNSIRKNKLHRVNKQLNQANSNSSFKVLAQDKQYLQNKLNNTRSQQIFNNPNGIGSSTVKSFYSKHKKIQQNNGPSHFNTFYASQQKNNSQGHQKYINSKIQKINQRKSLKNIGNKTNLMQIRQNSIQKSSSHKTYISNHKGYLNQPNQIHQEHQNQLIQDEKTIKNNQKHINQYTHFTPKNVINRNSENKFSKNRNHQQFPNQQIQINNSRNQGISFNQSGLNQSTTLKNHDNRHMNENKIKNSQLESKQNLNKLKRNYHPLIKNPNLNRKVQLNPCIQESQTLSGVNYKNKLYNQNQNQQNQFPDKSFDFSINDHLEKNNPQYKQNKNSSKQQNKFQLSGKYTSSKVNQNKNQSHQGEQQRKQKDHKKSFSDLNTNQNLQENQTLSKQKYQKNYKQFLRLLSEENDKKRNFQDLQNQKKLQFTLRNSRFKSIQQQNDHIKRIITPIGQSFLQQRRRKLSEERRIKQKYKNNGSYPKQIDGSIIESDQQLSQRTVNRNKHNRNKNKHQSQSPFEKNMRLNKIKVSSQHTSHDNYQYKISQKKMEIRGRINSFQEYLQVEGKKQDFQEIQAIKNVSNLKNDKNSKNSKKEQVFQKLAGVKIPQKVVYNTSSKINRIKHIYTPNKNEKLNTKHLQEYRDQQQTNNGRKSNSGQKIVRNNQRLQHKNNQDKKQNLNFLNKKQENQVTKNKVSKLQQKNKKIAQEKERNFKNWKNSQGIQKQSLAKKSHHKNQKSINSKNWRQSSKNKAQQKQINRKQQDYIGVHEQQHSKLGQKMVVKDKIKGQNMNINKKNIQNKRNDVISNVRLDQFNQLQQDSPFVDVEENYKPQLQQNINENNQKYQIEQGMQKISKNEQSSSLHQSSSQNKQILQKNDKKYVSFLQNKSPQQHNQSQERKPNLSNTPQFIEKNDDSMCVINKTEQLNQQSIVQKHNQFQNIKKSQMNEKIKSQVIKNILMNDQMNQEGLMEISESKFHIYNNQSQKSILQNYDQKDQPTLQIEQKRALIVKFLYSLPDQYQKQISKFHSNEVSKKIITKQSLQQLNTEVLQHVRYKNIKKALQQIMVYQKIDKIPQKDKSKKQDQKKNLSKSFLIKLFEPYLSVDNQIGIWLHCAGVWRLIFLKNNLLQNKTLNSDKNLIIHVQKAIQQAVSIYYPHIECSDLKVEQILKMITGLRISTLIKSKKNKQKIFKQIQYHIKKSHLIKAVSNGISEKFSEKTINCVRKLQNTPNGEKVVQIVSYSIDQNRQNIKYFWIKEQKFLDFFDSFTVLSTRNLPSYWTNTLLNVQNQNKAVYMIESVERHTSGSITIFPLKDEIIEKRNKCIIAFYKQVQPQVLKLIGKASQKLPQSTDELHSSKLYFQFNIKGTYYVFLQLQDGQYNISVESNSSQTTLQFIQKVKKQTLKNQQCEYVEIDKMFKRKPQINHFQNSNQFKKLINFMKRTNPNIEQKN